MAITLRATKGSALTHTELDTNFSDLQTGQTSAAAITGGSVTGITDLAIADGGTGASTEQGARTNLGVAEYTTGSFTMTTTGMTVNASDIAHYEKIGNMVFLHIPQLFGTSNSTSFELTGLPAAIIPDNGTAGINSETPYFSLPGVMNNGVATTAGTAKILATGTKILLSINRNATAWTASGAKSISRCMIAYSIDDATDLNY